MREGSRGRAAVLVTALLAGAAGPTGAASAERLPDDDLAVVKKAVTSRPRASEERTSASRRPGQWLKVRIVERGGKGSRVSVSLPLAAARVLGDDLPIEVGEGRIRLSEILRSLEAGEALVEVKDGDSTVRVWVE